MFSDAIEIAPGPGAAMAARDQQRSAQARAARRLSPLPSRDPKLTHPKPAGSGHAQPWLEASVAGLEATQTISSSTLNCDSPVMKSLSPALLGIYSRTRRSETRAWPAAKSRCERVPMRFMTGLCAAALSAGVAHPAQAQTPNLAVGETVAAVGKTYAFSASSPRRAGDRRPRSPANQGVVIAGPANNPYTQWQVAFSDDLTGWVYQGSLTAATPGAPILVFSANPTYVALGGSATLTWSSTDATSCSGVGFSPSGVSGSSSVSPARSTTYRITCTGSGGSTTRSFPVIVNPVPVFSWKQSLPVVFQAPGIVPFGGTETRALVFMDGSLYAGIGDWEDPQLENPKTPGAQVLRLDSSTSTWVEDQNFIQVVSSRGNKDYQAVTALATAHFDHDSGLNPITPVDVLLAGFWNLNISGLNVAQKTVKAGSVGAQGTWTVNLLVPPPSTSAEVRSFASYTDSVTHEEMAFAGSNPYGVFSGAFYPGSNGVQWDAAAEAGTASLTANGDRVMSFAACGGKLYASIYSAIVVRTDGAKPSWRIFYKYSGPALPSQSSGFRGLTCVANLNGSGSMLIAALESNSADIYEFPLDGSQPSIEAPVPRTILRACWEPGSATASARTTT